MQNLTKEDIYIIIDILGADICNAANDGDNYVMGHNIESIQKIIKKLNKYGDNCRCTE